MIKAIQVEVNEVLHLTNMTFCQINEGKITLDGTKIQLDQLFKVIEATDLGIGLAMNNIGEQDHILKFLPKVWKMSILLLI